MLVIHPEEKTTAMLSALYDGLEAQVVDDCRSTKEMGHLLRHVSTQERIMLLGHGSDKGLFFRKDDSKEEFDKIIVGHSHAYHLRKHGGNAKIEDGMTAELYPFGFASISRRDIFFQYKMKVDDREWLQMTLSYHRS